MYGVQGIHWTYRAEFRHANAEPRPRDLERSASCVMRTESMNIEPVRETRRAILFFMAGVDSPFRPCRHSTLQSIWKKNTQKKVPTLSSKNPRTLASHLHLAQTTRTSLKNTIYGR